MSLESNPFDMHNDDDDLLLISGDLNFGNDQDQGAEGIANPATQNDAKEEEPAASD